MYEGIVAFNDGEASAELFIKSHYTLCIFNWQNVAFLSQYGGVVMNIYCLLLLMTEAINKQGRRHIEAIKFHHTIHFLVSRIINGP